MMNMGGGGLAVPGPGAAFFEAVRADLGYLPFIAEDLGIITPMWLRFAIDSFGSAGCEVGKKKRERHFRFPEDKMVGLRVKMRTVRRVRAADNHGFATSFGFVDQFHGITLLGHHSADQNEIRPIKNRRVPLLHIAIEEPDVPILRQHRGDGYQPERGGGISRATEVTRLAVIPKGVGAEFRI